jgi:hypothetical protein
MKKMKKMKTRKYLGFAMAIAIPLALCVHCTEDYMKAEKPAVTIGVSKNPAAVGEDVIFTVTGKAEFLSIWTGDKAHNYDSYLAYIAEGDTTPGRIKKPENLGKIIEKDTYKYSYDEAGTYKVVILASDAGDFGDALEVQKIELQMVVQ